MTISQAQAIWELFRQGLHMSADEAERNWDHGETYQLDGHVHVPRRTTALIERCNREIRMSGGSHDQDILDMTAPRDVWLRYNSLQ